jgi:hypothetical protein
MNNTLAACFLAVSQAFAQCAADAATVGPVWQNDTVANAISFQDTFGHQVQIGVYDPATGLWTAGRRERLLILACLATNCGRDV